MIRKDIKYCGQSATVVCDGKCSKAWGINNRPKLQLDPQNEDDIVWLADCELGDAPADPGTYEGFQAKPTCDEERMNKWCVRECERSDMFRPGVEVKVKDWSKRRANMPGREKVVEDIKVEVYGLEFMKLIPQNPELVQDEEETHGRRDGSGGDSQSE